MVYTARKTYRTAVIKKKVEYHCYCYCYDCCCYVAAANRRRNSSAANLRNRPRDRQCWNRGPCSPKDSSMLAKQHLPRAHLGVWRTLWQRQSTKWHQSAYLQYVVGATKKIPFLMSRKESEQRQRTRQTTPDSCCCCGSQCWLVTVLVFV